MENIDKYFLYIFVADLLLDALENDQYQIIEFTTLCGIPWEIIKIEKVLLKDYNPDKIVYIYYKQLYTTKSTLITLIGKIITKDKITQHVFESFEE